MRYVKESGYFPVEYKTLNIDKASMGRDQLLSRPG